MASDGPDGTARTWTALQLTGRGTKRREMVRRELQGFGLRRRRSSKARDRRGDEEGEKIAERRMKGI